jgi:hypothetical protein
MNIPQMTIQQNDCYIGVKESKKASEKSLLKVLGTGLNSTLLGVGLIPIIGVREVLDAILANHWLIAQRLIEALIKGDTSHKTP